MHIDDTERMTKSSCVPTVCRHIDDTEGITKSGCVLIVCKRIDDTEGMAISSYVPTVWMHIFWQRSDNQTCFDDCRDIVLAILDFKLNLFPLITSRALVI